MAPKLQQMPSSAQHCPRWRSCCAQAQCLRVLSTACFFPSAFPRPGRRGCLNGRRGLSSLDFYVLLEFNNEDPRLTLHYTGRGRSDAALGIRVQPSRGVRPKTASVALGPCLRRLRDLLCVLQKSCWAALATSLADCLKAFRVLPGSCGFRLDFCSRCSPSDRGPSDLRNEHGAQ